MTNDDYLKVSDGELPIPDICETPDPELNDPRFTYVKTEAAKRFLREKWEAMFEQRKERNKRASSFKAQLKAAKLSQRERKRAEKAFSQTESDLTRMQRIRLSTKDFEKIQLIGRGASGEIWLVRDKISKEYYALKIINKLTIIINDQAESIKSERTLLASINNPWIVKLIYSFQDPENLYYVLEFVQGGDLCSLLNRLTTLDENIARYYIAEIALAIQSVHNLGFVHRDIKPDNVLITTRGHLKLTDFGLSTRFEKRDTGFLRVLEELKKLLVKDEQNIVTDPHLTSDKPMSMVGTVEYVAPEVLAEEEYDARCDWWSLGILMYEMLYGITPFATSNPTSTALKILKWRQNLSFPSVPKLSEDAIDLMKGLITSTDKRLNFKGIQSHKFFADFNWDELETIDGPLIPEVSSPTDTSAFEPAEGLPLNLTMTESDPKLTKYAFLGFTYKSKKRNRIRSVDIGFS
ncbi:Serine/threonine-protein kinase CBK1 [Tritrichomonas foetus]|uniref:non-specific serine/threonine protein kinase n=1 Tax=Tritrichomonas foetus TaxID=1144522 RepID=A0A1J4JQ96_9EUKA|nr:Serine/threonine-protein kinase CBK1 [Tritrichomonas foetus]|eukprot:OHS99691.1 Serine/threonine-protein kinase CBK1 [Tritrichomonas foetus]